MAENKKGLVYVGKKCSRGKEGRDPSLPGVKNINATSGSVNKINGHSATAFSPMYLGPVVEAEIFGRGDGVACNVENYWQYGKKFEQLEHLKNRHVWETFRRFGYAKKGGDRHPKGTKSTEVKFVANGKNYYKYYTAVSSEYMGEEMGYIESRKRIYIIVYAYLVRRTPAFEELKRLVDEGASVMILDFDVLDGHREVTTALLRDRINDAALPFGHGYVLAGLLNDISPEDYV